MKFYVDEECKCHTLNDGTMREFKSDFFDGRCAEFIEGYMFVPAGETYIRMDGVKFSGEMIVPFVNFDLLEKYQHMEDSHTAELAALIEEIYNEDLEAIENV